MAQCLAHGKDSVKTTVIRFINSSYYGQGMARRTELIKINTVGGKCC